MAERLEVPSDFTVDRESLGRADSFEDVNFDLFIDYCPIDAAPDRHDANILVASDPFAVHNEPIHAAPDLFDDTFAFNPGAWGCDPINRQYQVVGDGGGWWLDDGCSAAALADGGFALGDGGSAGGLDGEGSVLDHGGLAGGGLGLGEVGLAQRFEGMAAQTGNGDGSVEDGSSASSAETATGASSRRHHRRSLASDRARSYRAETRGRAQQLNDLRRKAMLKGVCTPEDIVDMENKAKALYIKGWRQRMLATLKERMGIRE